MIAASRVLRRRQLGTRKQYRRMQLFYWVYALSWLAAIIFVLPKHLLRFWDFAAWAALLLATPDAASLVQTYAGYREWWFKAHTTGDDGAEPFPGDTTRTAPSQLGGESKGPPSRAELTSVYLGTSDVRTRSPL